MTNRTLRAGLFALILMLSIGGAALAQPLIGVVDVGLVFEQSLAGREADQMLQAFVAERQQVVDELQAELDELDRRLDEMTDGDERDALQAEFDEKFAAMRQRVQQFQEEINATLADFRGQLLSDIHMVLQMFGQEHGYDIILDSDSLAYFNEAMDVTEAVIEKYDELLQESRSLVD